MCAYINFDALIFDTRNNIANATRLTSTQKSALFLRLEEALYDYEHARNPYSKQAARTKTIRLCGRLSERAEDGYKRLPG